MTSGSVQYVDICWGISLAKRTREEQSALGLSKNRIGYLRTERSTSLTCLSTEIHYHSPHKRCPGCRGCARAEDGDYRSAVWQTCCALTWRLSARYQREGGQAAAVPMQARALRPPGALPPSLDAAFSAGASVGCASGEEISQVMPPRSWLDEKQRERQSQSDKQKRWAQHAQSSGSAITQNWGIAM